MRNERSISLVTCDSRLRAGVSRTLLSMGIHVEPFEDIGELSQHWPSHGLIVVEDCADNISGLVADMTLGANWLPIIAFSQTPQTRHIVAAIMNGAVDYIVWPCGGEDLRSTIELAERNGSATGSLRLREARARSRIDKLTNRERQVLAGVADGLSNRLIGERLEISPRTVEIHRANMLTKIGANHTSEAIRIAIEAALLN